MIDAPPPQRRWYEQGWVPLVFILGLIVVAVVITQHAPPSTTTKSQSITLNPAALDAIPSTDVEVRSTDDPSDGPVTAKVVVVEFGDFQCPFCQQAFPVLRQVMQEYHDRVLFQYRDYPITELHPDARAAAAAGQCAWQVGGDKFWAFHDRLFQNQTDLSVTVLKAAAVSSGLDATAFDPCLDQGQTTTEVTADLADGVRAGVRGTPTFFINGHRYEGPLTLDLFRQILNTELRANQ